MTRVNNKVTEATKKNTIELVKYLQKKYNVPNSRVVRHYDASRKNCPSSMSANNWAEWKEFYKRITGSNAADNLQPPSPSGNTSAIGTVTIEVDSLNVRKGAGTNYGVIKTIKKGQSYKYYTKESNGWIDLGNGQWVNGSTKYVSYGKSVSYYKIPMYKGDSLVDALDSIRVDGSLTNRKKIASVNGIPNYSGGADQNADLLEKLKEGKLIKN